MVEWIIEKTIEHKEWLFSGAGIAVIFGIVWLVKRILRKIREDSADSQGADDGESSGGCSEFSEGPTEQEGKKRDYKLNPSPEDIFEDIESRPPFQRKEAEKYYQSLKVKRWAVTIRLVFEPHDGKCQIHLRPRSNGKIVSCLVDIHRYPEVKIADEKTRLWVSGRIKYVDWESGEIALFDASLEFE